MLPVVYDVPVANDDPPVNAAYQLTVPAVALAPKVTVPASQRAAGVVDEMAGVVFTVAITSVLDDVVQELLVASTQYEVVNEMLPVVYDAPVANDDPPVAAAYQLTVPAVALAPKVTVPASQRAAGVVDEMAGVVFTVAITSVLDDVVQELLVASTQYEVVNEMLPVVYDAPVANDDPPVAAAYQLTVPAVALAPKVTVPASQRAAGVVDEMAGVVFTVAITSVLDDVVQELLVASTQYEVVDEMLPVVYDAPVANDDPPVASAYQLTVPAVALAPKVTVPASQRAEGVVDLSLIHI